MAHGEYIGINVERLKDLTAITVESITIEGLSIHLNGMATLTIKPMTNMLSTTTKAITYLCHIFN